MSTSNPRVPNDQRDVPSCRRRYSDQFKRDALRLVSQERYTFRAAAEAVGVSEKSLREWHKKLSPPPEPCGDGASVQELQQENRRLREQLRRAEMEREILKKATAYFASQNP